MSIQPTDGDGVLACDGALIVLCGAGDDGAVDAVLAAHAAVAQAGQDGNALADRVEQAAGTLPYVVLGPVGNAVLVAVRGHAFASVRTEYGEQNLAMHGPADGVRLVLPGRLDGVRAGLGDPDPDAAPQRWTSVEHGTLRAGGLVFTPSEAAADAPVAPPAQSVSFPTPPAPPAEPPVPLPIVTAHEPAPVPVAPPVPSPPAPSTTSEVPIVPATPPAPPPASGPPSGPTPEMPSVAPPEPSVDRSLRFESVSLLPGASAPPAEPRRPLPVVAAPQSPAPDVAAPEHSVDDSRPQVLGVYCKNGHFDDPAARYCAVCGISMAQLTLQPRQGPRPPLGVLVLDDGSVFSLDIDYVIGRDPSQDPDVQSGAARALRFDDAEGVLSRRHARVVLNDWTVQIVDLGSANGTGVWGPGDNGWHQIPSRTPITLRPGTQIGFGRRNLRYESHRNT